MDTRLAGLSRSIDQAELGRRIRDARVAAGLTQTELAGDDITAGYVSRIEDGQRRPGFPLLQRIAARIGVTVSSLLEPTSLHDAAAAAMVLLDRAELHLVTGGAREALEVLDRVGAEPISEPTLERRLKVLRARALEAVGQLNEAIMILEGLSVEPVADAEWISGLIALCRCYRETGDLDRSVRSGEEAQELIESLGLGGLTESIQLSVTIALSYMLRGDLEHAMRICMRAAEEAEDLRSPAAQASAYWNASLIESQKGAHASALELARKALVYFEIGEDARNLARLRGHLADVQLLQVPPDAAGALETLSVSIAELATTDASPVDRASQLQTRARANLLLGHTRAALDDLDESFATLPDEAGIERAFGLVLRGEIHLSAGSTEAGRKDLLAAVHELTGLGADREAAQLWYELGAHLKEIGETEAALDALTRAAAASGLRSPSFASPDRTPAR